MDHSLRYISGDYVEQRGGATAVADCYWLMLLLRMLLQMLLQMLLWMLLRVLLQMQLRMLLQTLMHTATATMDTSADTAAYCYCHYCYFLLIGYGGFCLLHGYCTTIQLQ